MLINNHNIFIQFDFNEIYGLHNHYLTQVLQFLIKSRP